MGISTTCQQRKRTIAIGSVTLAPGALQTGLSLLLLLLLYDITSMPFIT